jgi:hypothetical protein
MVNFASNVFLIALLLCLVSRPAYGLVDTTAGKAAFQFLEASVSPRQIAMGNAGAAMPGVGFVTYNPAQPFFSNDPSLSIGYSPLPGDLKAVFAEGFWNQADLFFGIHLSNHSISDIIPSTIQGTNENAPFSSGFSLVSFAGGLKRERFALAIAVSGMQDRIGVSTAYGVAVSAGAAYRAIPGKLSLGLGLLNEGTTTGYTDETSKWGDGDRMPRSARFGAAYTDTLRRIPFTAALDVVYRDVGDKLHAVKGIAPRMTLPVGIEVWPLEYIAVRMGKRINFETEVINVGVGFRFRPLSFDMSFVIANLDNEVKPAFGLTYTPELRNKSRAVITAPAAVVKPLPQPEQLSIDTTKQRQSPSPVPPRSEPQPQKSAQPQSEKQSPLVPVAPAQPEVIDPTQNPVNIEKAATDTISLPEENP